MSTEDQRADGRKPFLSDLVQASRHHLGGRRAWIAWAIVVAAAGLALNWRWLVTAGLAPTPYGPTALRSNVRPQSAHEQKGARRQQEARWFRSDIVGLGEGDCRGRWDA